MNGMLIIMGGLPATGKTTICRALARRLDAVHLRIDTIEQAIVRSGAAEHPIGAAGYLVGYALAEDHLRQGQSVIADSVNPLPVTRDAWRKHADAAGVPVVEIELICSDPAEHRRRVTGRTGDIADLPLPGWEAVTARDYRPWDREHIVCDTAGRTVADCVTELERRIRGAGAGTATEVEVDAGTTPHEVMRTAGRLPLDRQLDVLRDVLVRNETLTEALVRAAELDLPGWYLTAGCVYQTVWNVITGRPPADGIKDYDLVYFDDTDLSEAAEQRAADAAERAFAGLPLVADVHNEARMHLRHERKHGVPCPPHTSTEAAIDTFQAMACCLGIRLDEEGAWRCYAPYGLSDVFNLVARPNPVLATPAVYAAKTDRWRRRWPELTVLPWPEPCRPGQRTGWRRIVRGSG